MSGTSRNSAAEPAQGSIHTVNPVTGAMGKAYRGHTLDEARSIAAHCAAAQKLWRKTPIAERSRLMHAAARVMRANNARYATLMTEEMGKTVTEGLGEIEKCAATADYFVGDEHKVIRCRVWRTEVDTRP